MNELLQFIYRRRSIRQFANTPIPNDTLEELLRAGMAAPSAMNAQPWEFVVVTDPEILKKFRSSLMFAKHDYTALICVCGSEHAQKNRAGSRFWVQDCSAATENILLAATALGLGSVWIGIYPITMFIRTVKSILNLPEGVTPLNLIGLGFPAEDKEARSQYDETRIHWQTYAPVSQRRMHLFRRRKDETILENSKEE